MTKVRIFVAAMVVIAISATVLTRVTNVLVANTGLSQPTATATGTKAVHRLAALPVRRSDVSTPTAVVRPQAPRNFQPAVKIPANAAPRNVVLIVLDGARPDYFAVPNIPHVQALIRNGTRYTNAWANILESETPSGHAAITTGSQPRRDGILSFDWANSDNISINLFDEGKVRAGAMEQVMRRSTAPTIAGLIHKRNPKARVVSLSGYKYYAADALGGPDADVIMYFAGRQNGTFGPTAVPGHMPPASVLNAPGLTIPNRSYPLGAGNRLAMKLAGTTFEQLHQQVTLINLPEFDWPLGHVNGANRDRRGVTTLMQGFDRDLAVLEDVYRRAGVLSRTVFVLTADHGTAPIDHKISKNVIDNAVLATGTRIIRDTYHTASYVWLQNESKAAEAAANIARKQNPHIQSVYYRAQGASGPVYLRASGADRFRSAGMEQANQYLLSTFNGPNGPDLAVFLTEHSMAVAGAESTWKGDHGGAAWESQHLPLILSGPGIRKGYTSSYPAPLMDIAPTLLSLMNVAPTGMQGTALADALQTPSAAGRAAQQSQGQILGPVVTSLIAESHREVAAHQ